MPGPARGRAATRADLAWECRADLAWECRADLAWECRADLAWECRAGLARECNDLKAPSRADTRAVPAVVAGTAVVNQWRDSMRRRRRWVVGACARAAAAVSETGATVQSGWPGIGGVLVL